MTDQRTSQTGDLTVKPLAEVGAGAVRSFFERIPESDRTFFREDVLDDATLMAWFDDRRNRRSVALVGDEVVGYLAVLPGVGWSAHVGELRIVVDPGRRRSGIGQMLARTGLLVSLELGLTKVVVEIVADQEALLAMFHSLGFEAEGLLRGHVKTAQGELHDLLLLAHSVDDTWAGMATAGIEDDLA